MGFEVVYCFKCGKRIAEADFLKGRAFRVQSQTACRACSGELLKEFPPDVQEAILAGAPIPVKPNSAAALAATAAPLPAPQPMPAPQPVPTASRATLPAVRPSRAPLLVIGLAAAIGVILLIAMAGRSRPPRPARPEPVPDQGEPAAPPTPAPPPPRVEDERAAAAHSALQQAREYRKARPDDHAAILRFFNLAVEAAERTPYEAEAQREREAMLEDQRAALEPTRREFDAELRPLLDRREFRKAFDAVGAARSRNGSPEWTRMMDHKIREIREQVDSEYARLKIKAADARRRGLKAVEDEVRRDVATWELPPYADELERVLASVQPAAEPKPTPAPSAPAAPAPSTPDKTFPASAAPAPPAPDPSAPTAPAPPAPDKTIPASAAPAPPGPEPSAPSLLTPPDLPAPEPSDPSVLAAARSAAPASPAPDPAVEAFGQKWRAAVQALAPGWTVSRVGLQALYDRSRDPQYPLAVADPAKGFGTCPADPAAPCILSRAVVLPPRPKHEIHVEVGGHPQGEFDLLVKANGKELLRKTVGKPAAKEAPAASETVGLGDFAGQTAKLEIHHTARGAEHGEACWRKIAVRPVLAARARIAASHVWSTDAPTALNDGIEPRRSSDDALPRLTWYPQRGTREWVQYEFAAPETVSSAEVYWFEETGGGACRMPQTWRLLYKSGQVWKPVDGASAFETKPDRFNRVTFTPVQTTALRLEVKLQPNFSGGILEWKVGP